MPSVEMPRTDPRLFGITPYMDVNGLRDNTHQQVTAMLREDFADFLREPTQVNMHVVVQQLLSYQDSVALGRRRKAAS